MLINFATKIARRVLVGNKQKFVFLEKDRIEFPPLEKIDLYIHIPFCKNLCPYCPYSRIPYDKNLVGPYLKAVLNEIEQYHSKLGKIEITSIYIGGGTPTNLVDELGIILNTLREEFFVSGNICIETNPSDLNREVLKKLKNFGIDLISIGVQSFDNEDLKKIGRKYNSKEAEESIRIALSENFKSVNIDLMFVLPGQNEEEILSNLQKAVELGVDQITVYPLFTFPHAPIGRYLKMNKVKMPDIFKRRKEYKRIYDFCVQNGYHQDSVWAFKKGDVPRYSSVTRDNYIGIGAGACSRLPEVFYFNTFSVEEYINAALTGKLPIALAMDIGSSLSKYYWLYWRIYDARIDKNELQKVFGSKDIKIKLIFWMAKLLGLCTEHEDVIELTERGSFYIHLLQNYFILNYINKVWTAAMKEPWPKSIKI